MAIHLSWRMKKSRQAILLTALVMLFFIRSATNTPLVDITYQIKQDAQNFSSSLETLVKAADEFQLDASNAKALRQSLSEARLAYKKIEFLLEYYYPEYVEEHINGAPLLHIKRAGTRPNVLPPEGLQILDELIFAENPSEEKTEIAILARKLINDFQILNASFSTKKTTKPELVEAMRMELVRLFAMGVTGFDTPGSLNALAEASVSLESLRQVSLWLSSESDEIEGLQTNYWFQSGLNQLRQANNFDRFDRLKFLKECIDPLYNSLSDYASVDSLSAQKKRGWNSDSKSVFAKDFLDPYFYTEMDKWEDSEDLYALGQKLFYDPILSGSGQMSCASCHNPERGFTDGIAKSKSRLEDLSVDRNSPTLLNAVYSDRYFYDLRAFSLEQQAEHVIFNQKEFNTGYKEILGKLNADGEYQKLTKKVFASKELDRDQFSKALASYVLSLQSFNSEFDQYVRGEVKTINPKIKEGFNLFMGRAACGTCHFAPTFAGLVPPLYSKNESEILGVLDEPLSDELDDDKGRLASDMHSEMAWIYERSFKTSTVRNVELTAPYFHNGMYSNLEEVVDFYDHGGGAGLGIEVPNQTLAPDSLKLSSHEKEALVAFMKALTDNPVEYIYQ